MGIFTIEKWKCDRCEVVYDKRPTLNYPQAKLNYSLLWEWSDQQLSWKELCPHCNNLIYEQMEELKPREKATSDETSSSRD